MKEKALSEEQYLRFIRKLHPFANLEFPSMNNKMKCVNLGMNIRSLAEFYANNSENVKYLVKSDDPHTPVMLESSSTRFGLNWSDTNYSNYLFIPIHNLDEVKDGDTKAVKLERIFNNILIKEFAAKHSTFKLFAYSSDITRVMNEYLFHKLSEFFKNITLFPADDTLKMQLAVYAFNLIDTEEIKSNLKHSLESLASSSDDSKKQFADLYRKLETKFTPACATLSDSGIAIEIDKYELNSAVRATSDRHGYYKKNMAGPFNSFTAEDLEIIKYLFTKAIEFNEDLATSLLATLSEGGLNKGCEYVELNTLRDKYSRLIGKDAILNERLIQGVFIPDLEVLAAIEELCCNFWKKPKYGPKYKISHQKYLEGASYSDHVDFFQHALLQIHYIAEHCESENLENLYNTLVPILASQKLIIESFKTLHSETFREAKTSIEKLYTAFARKVLCQYKDILENLKFDEFSDLNQSRDGIINYMLNFSDNPTILMQIAKLTYNIGSENLKKLVKYDNGVLLKICYLKLLVQDTNHENDWLYDGLGDLLFTGISTGTEWPEQLQQAAGFYQVHHNYGKIVGCYKYIIARIRSADYLTRLADIHEEYGHYRDASIALIEVFGLTVAPEERKEIAERIVACEKKHLAGDVPIEDKESLPPDYEIIDLSCFAEEFGGFTSLPYEALLGEAATES